MILPNKNILLSNSLLGTGSKMLIELKFPQTISSLWENVRNDKKIKSFEKFVLTLDLLYSIGLIEIEEGIIKKVKK